MNLRLVSKWRTELMGLAAIWILYFHVGGDPLFPSYKYLSYVGRFLLEGGYGGVDIFLFLSGIGIFYSLDKKKEGKFEFYKKRFLRVYPAFFVLFLFAYLKAAETINIRRIIGNLTFYINWKENIYSGGWYIATILVFYLVTPFYYAVFKRVRYKSILTIIMCLFSVGLMPLYEMMNRWDLKSVVQRIPIYLIGLYVGWMLAEKKAEKFNGRKVSIILILGCFIVGVLMYGACIFLPQYSRYSCYPCILMVPSLCIVAASIMERVQCFWGKGNFFAGLKYIGMCSLEFYLLQEPAIGFRGLIDQIIIFEYLQGSGLQKLIIFFIKLIIYSGVASVLHQIIGCITRQNRN